MSDASVHRRCRFCRTSRSGILQGNQVAAVDGVAEEDAGVKLGDHRFVRRPRPWPSGHVRGTSRSRSFLPPTMIL